MSIIMKFNEWIYVKAYVREGFLRVIGLPTRVGRFGFYRFRTFQ